MIRHLSYRITATLIVFLFSLPAVSFAGEFNVIRVYNGDTLKAKGHGIEFKVSLIGIDAPETSKKKNDEGQPHSQQAKKFLASMVLDKTVFIKGYGNDRYNRILAEVFVYDKNVNLEMVKAGLAEYYRGEKPKRFDRMPYQLAETKAKNEGIGMWSLGNQYISPKDWRKMHR
jgi:endonuclease YncB( thermonuclease family)